MKKNFVIAIDGYSSCGKSTLAKALAKILSFVYIDSGAMYRAVTLYFIREGINIEDEDQVKQALAEIHIDVLHQPQGEIKILLNQENVSEEIRKMYVSDFVSEVSALKLVRDAMVAQQQKLGKKHNIVMDGRDIGTRVFPQADLKIFMTADPLIRAERRYKELLEKGEESSLEAVIENLQHRDHIDTTREESPLVRSADAILLDNSALTEEQQLNFVLDQVALLKTAE